MFKTVSFHLTKPCNMSCKYCFATFQDFKVNNQLSLANACTIIDKLKSAGVEKVTFAGGEPMIYKHLVKLIKYAKAQGMTTSIITNGSLVSWDFLLELKEYLDWFGLSVDSTVKATNNLIGRTFKNSLSGKFPMTRNHYLMLINQARFLGMKIKINTVVNQFNQDEDMQAFIDKVNPDRWKVFDTLRVVGQNDIHWNDVKSTKFYEFIGRHSHPNMVVEDNRLMTSSYVLIDPLGRIFDDTLGLHTYSDSLLTHSVEHCLSQVKLDESKFIERGGLYNW